MENDYAMRIILSRVLPHRFVPQLVRWSVDPHFAFWRFWAFWAHCSCPNAPVTFYTTAPAHPHATRVAVYPALLFILPNGVCFMRIWKGLKAYDN